MKQQGIQDQLRRITADRHSPEAKELYLTLVRYAQRRTARLGRNRYPDLLTYAEQEEVVGEVLYQLMAGSLVRFKGDTLPELLAYVRSITDRCVWRQARRRLRERDALEGEAGDAVREWTRALPQPDQVVHLESVNPLAEQDASYLEALFAAGSRSSYAREAGVSRAAVTQRVQRIRARIEAMSSGDQMAVEAWAHRLAVDSARTRQA